MQNSTEDVIFEALQKFFSSELVVIEDLSEKRRINNSTEQLSVELGGTGLFIGDNSSYDYVKSVLSISVGDDTRNLCSKYTGTEPPDSHKYNVLLLWEGPGFLLSIGDHPYSERLEPFLKHKGIEVVSFMNKLNNMYKELSAS